MTGGGVLPKEKSDGEAPAHSMLNHAEGAQADAAAAAIRPMDSRLALQEASDKHDQLKSGLLEEMASVHTAEVEAEAEELEIASLSDTPEENPMKTRVRQEQLISADQHVPSDLSNGCQLGALDEEIDELKLIQVEIRSEASNHSEIVRLWLSRAWSTWEMAQ